MGVCAWRTSRPLLSRRAAPPCARGAGFETGFADCGSPGLGRVDAWARGSRTEPGRGGPASGQDCPDCIEAHCTDCSLRASPRNGPTERRACATDRDHARSHGISARSNGLLGCGRGVAWRRGRRSRREPDHAGTRGPFKGGADTSGLSPEWRVAGPGGSSRARCSNDRVVRPARKTAPPLSAPARGGYALAIRSVQANHRKVFLIWQRRLHSPNNQLPLWVAWFFTSESDLGHPASSVPSSSSSQARENRRSWHNVAGQMPGAGTGEHSVPQSGAAAWPHAPSGPCVSRQPDENGTAILHSRLFLARCSLARGR